MTVVSAESRANWERLQNRKTAKLLSVQDSARLIARDFRPKQQHWSVSWKLKNQKNPSRRLVKRARESDAAGEQVQEDPNKRMRVHLDLLKEYEQRQNKKLQDDRHVKKIKEEVTSFFDSAQEYGDKSKVQKLPAVKVEPQHTYSHSAFNLKVKVEEDDIIIPKLVASELMASDRRQTENQKIKEKALFDCERGIKDQASTDAFKCGRCHKRETTYYQLQTRSADEPMTTYVTCVNCNKHWKF